MAYRTVGFWIVGASVVGVVGSCARDRGSGPGDESSSGADTSGSDSATAGDTAGETDASSGGSRAPIAADDRCYVLAAEAELTVDAAHGLLVNDQDPDGDVLAVVGHDDASDQAASLSIGPAGELSYTVVPGSWGEDSFGYTVADPGGASSSARVHVFVAPAVADLSRAAAGFGGFVIAGESMDDRAGVGVSGAGDVNGDGFADLLVAADGAAGGAGRFYVVFGGSSLAEVVELGDIAGGAGGFSIESEAGVSGDGAVVAGGRDLNGDGRSDVVIGVPFANFGGDAAGRVYVVFGRSETTPVALADLASGGGFAFDGGSAGEHAGTAVALVDDMNGDGLAELAIGAERSDAGETDAGRAYVVFGRAETSPLTGAEVELGQGGFVIDGESALDGAGGAIAAAGDVNADGRGDVILGAAGGGTALNNTGKAYVVFGKTGTQRVSLAAVAAGEGGYAMEGESTNDLAGSSVAGLGDINGDGFDDLALGAVGVAANGAYSGRVYVVHGKPDGAQVALADVGAAVGGFTIDGEASDDAAGRRVALGGDLDGDGEVELLVGAPGADPHGSSSGRTYAVHVAAGSSDVALAQVVTGGFGFVFDGEAPDDFVGAAIGGAGDVNGDGLADLIIGSRGHDTGGSSRGRTYVVFGVPSGTGCEG